MSAPRNPLPLALSCVLTASADCAEQSNFDLVARVPLIVYIPWLPQSHGQSSDALVEIVDLMPTSEIVMLSLIRYAVRLAYPKIYHSCSAGADGHRRHRARSGAAGG